MCFVTIKHSGSHRKNINGKSEPDIQNIHLQQWGKHKNILNSFVTMFNKFDMKNTLLQYIYASFTEKYLHISGSLLFFVLLLRVISNLLISDERSLGEKTENFN